MITDNMRLTTRTDARVWADNMGLELSEEQTNRLVSWIWNAPTPYYPCAYIDHPVYGMEIDQLWEIVGD